MAQPVGRSTGAACELSTIETVGEYLPSSAVLSGFRAVLSAPSTGAIDIFARTVEPITGASRDAFLVCTIPSGTTGCSQIEPRVLTGPNLFAFQIGGNRTWSKIRLGYQLLPN